MEENFPVETTNLWGVVEHVWRKKSTELVAQIRGYKFPIFSVPLLFFKRRTILDRLKMIGDFGKKARRK